MEKKINYAGDVNGNLWCVTGGFYAADLRDEFYLHLDMGGCIDAPKAVPSGRTISIPSFGGETDAVIPEPLFFR